MEKLMSCFLAIMLLVGFSFAEDTIVDFDVSEYSYEQLVAIRSIVEAEIAKTNGEAYFIGPGIYMMNEDLPAGQYQITIFPINDCNVPVIIYVTRGVQDYSYASANTTCYVNLVLEGDGFSLTDCTAIIRKLNKMMFE